MTSSSIIRRSYDLVVVGAGSGGYAAARTARELGASVALVDHGPLGGLCILRGCMPSKAFIASSDAAYDAREAHKLGITARDIESNMPFIQARKRGLVKSFAEYRIEGINTFPLYEGNATFLSSTELCVGDTTIVEARKFIVATGSVIAPSTLPGLDEIGYLDSDTVLELEHIPESVVVLGGGYVACELGQFLARLGARTTLIIRSGQLLTYADTDVGEALTESFREEGIEVVTHARLLEARRDRDQKVIRIIAHGGERDIAAEQVFHALGRMPDVAGLGLDGVGVHYDPSHGITVDPRMRTSNPNIYAIGDVTGGYQLVHVAIYQGELAARNAVLDTHESADYRIMTAHTIFCDPQVAHVGRSEKDLLREGIPYVVGRYPFAEHGKAMVLGKTKGFVKIMADRENGEILGATVIGTEGSELIHEIIVAMNFHTTVQELMRIPHLHPTLAEIWTYPAEECAEQLGMKAPGDEQIEVATSGTAS